MWTDDKTKTVAELFAAVAKADDEPSEEVMRDMARGLFHVCSTGPEGVVLGRDMFLSLRPRTMAKLGEMILEAARDGDQFWARSEV